MSDLFVGQRFGRWTVVEIGFRHGTGRGVKKATRCLCDCGESKIVVNGNLKSGASTSCGCKTIEAMILRTRTHGAGAARENGSRAAQAWLDMHSRCFSEKKRSYKNYGARGISVCERWSDVDGFNNFLADMGEPPTGLSLERNDNDGDYSPSNCRWATRKEQQNNRRVCVYGWLDGQKLSAAEISRRVGVSKTCAVDRIRRGMYQLNQPQS